MAGYGDAVPQRRSAFDWELYDMNVDRTELRDLAAKGPERVRDMATHYDAWARHCGVLDCGKIVTLMKSQVVTPPSGSRTRSDDELRPGDRAGSGDPTEGTAFGRLACAGARETVGPWTS